jgi:hypothetical protein
MLTFLNDKILQIRKATGVEIFISSTGEWLANAVEVAVEKEKLMKDKEHHRTSIEELARKLPMENPVALSVSGKGILIKKITAEEFKGNYFELLFPNANPNDFHISFNEMGESVWIYLIRKNILDEIVNKVRTLGFKLLYISIGPSAIENIIPFLDLNSFSVIRSNAYLIKLDNKGEFTRIENSELTDDAGREEYNIGDQYIKAPIIGSFAVSLYLFSTNISERPDADRRIMEERENYRYAQYFKKTGWAALIFVLVVLLLNFTVYNHYFKLNQELQVSENLSKVRQIDEQKNQEKFNIESAFLQATGWDHRSKISFYADRIASLVPENTLLTNMQIFPMKEGSFQDENGTYFKMDTILVSGNCDDPENLAAFLSNLKNSTIVEFVGIKDYSYKKDKGKGYFNMEIITKK